MVRSGPRLFASAVLFAITVIACTAPPKDSIYQQGAGLHPEYETGYDPVLCSRSAFQKPEDLDCLAAKMREDYLAKFDVEGCMRRGGYIAGDGMFGLPSCRFDYSDGGKPCQDHAECQGKCIFEYGLDPEIESPTCTKDSSWAGCYSEVIGGVVQPAICYD